LVRLQVTRSHPEGPRHPGSYPPPLPRREQDLDGTRWATSLLCHLHRGPVPQNPGTSGWAKPARRERTNPTLLGPWCDQGEEETRRLQCGPLERVLLRGCRSMAPGWPEMAGGVDCVPGVQPFSRSRRCGPGSGGTVDSALLPRDHDIAIEPWNGKCGRSCGPSRVYATFRRDSRISSVALQAGGRGFEPRWLHVPEETAPLELMGSGGASVFRKMRPYCRFGRSQPTALTRSRASRARLISLWSGCW
jgi:hypothetical protein